MSSTKPWVALLLLCGLVQVPHCNSRLVTAEECPLKQCQVTTDGWFNPEVNFTCTQSGCTAIPVSSIEEGVNSLLLQENNIASVPKLEWADLKVLDLTKNNISIIDPKAFEKCPKLEYLSLASNKLVTIDAISSTDLTFWGLSNTKLKYLYLDSNRIGHIKDSVLRWTFSDLITLDLSNNRIVNLTADTLAGLDQLENLYLADNYIEMIEVDAFEDLDALQTLDLTRNRIKEIKKDTFYDCRSLSDLDLSHNQISALDKDAFYGLSRLKVLKLVDNKITSVDLIFGDVYNMEELYVDYNPIVVLTPDAMLPPSLKVLSITHMPQLQRVESGALSKATNLGVVKMSDNAKLTFIAKHAFRDNATTSQTALYDLDLSHNALSSFSDLAVSWEKVETVRLLGNPWHCDCMLMWVKDIPVLTDTPDLLQHVICASPHHLKGRSVANIPIDEFTCHTHTSHYNLALALIAVTTALFVVGTLMFLYKYRVWAFPCLYKTPDKYSALQDEDDRGDASTTVMYKRQQYDAPVHKGNSNAPVAV